MRISLDRAAARAQVVGMDKPDFSQHPDGRRQGSVASGIQAYAGAFALIAVSTLIGLWIAPRWGTAPVDMIYLPAVLATAALWGLGPALLAGVGAALAYN